MSAGASVSALQRLVEQLKLEAGVERIKVSAAAGDRCQPRRPGSGSQDAAARPKWRLPGQVRAGASRAREPRVDAGWLRARPPGQRRRPTGAPPHAASPRAPWACPHRAGDTLAAWALPDRRQPEDAV